MSNNRSKYSLGTVVVLPEVQIVAARVFRVHACVRNATFILLNRSFAFAQRFWISTQQLLTVAVNGRKLPTGDGRKCLS